MSYIYQKYTDNRGKERAEGDYGSKVYIHGWLTSKKTFETIEEAKAEVEKFLAGGVDPKNLRICKIEQ
ncbi:hypothetical protein ACI2JA_03520 [Alkalihalobacillus sp. NPDC078783]